MKWKVTYLSNAFPDKRERNGVYECVGRAHSLQYYEMLRDGAPSNGVSAVFVWMGPKIVRQWMRV